MNTKNRKCMYQIDSAALDRYVHLYGFWDEHGQVLNSSEMRPEQLVGKVYRKARLSDCIPAGLDLVVSSRAREVISGYRVADGVRWVPLTVKTERDVVLAENYWFMQGTRTHDVLDYAHAEYEFYEGTEVLWRVKHWVLDRHELPEADLFMGTVYRWFCTDRLRAAIIEAKLTNFAFLPVEVM